MTQFLRPAALRAAAGLAGLAVTAASSGCDVSLRRAEYHTTENVQITEIVLATRGSGDVVIRTADVSEVRIGRVVSFRRNEPDTTYRIEGTVLSLDTDCGRHCWVSYDITAPRGVTVRGENGSGDVKLTDVARVDVTVESGSITVDGASDTVRARTGSGDISVAGVKSGVTLEAGSGDITGRELGGGEVTAQTGSGDISLTLDTPQSVRAEAGSGGITVLVPEGSYRVNASTDSGDRDVHLADDPSAALHLDLRTGSGDITLTRRH